MAEETVSTHDDPNNWPAKFGFITKPEEMRGRTITEIRRVEMEYGCAHREALFLRFQDGSRGFLLASDAGHCLPSPTLESMKKAEAYTPEEVGRIVVAAEARRQRKTRESLDHKRNQLAQLKKELGES